MKKILSVFLLSCVMCVSFAQTLTLRVDSLTKALKETETVEGCRIHKNTVKAAAYNFLKAPYSKKDNIVRLSCLQLLLKWSENTDELTIGLSENMHEGLLAKGIKDHELLSVYIAAVDYYAINTGIREVTLDAYIYAMEESLYFYEKYTKFIGKSKYWEKLLKLSADERIARYAELYKKDNQ